MEFTYELKIPRARIPMLVGKQGVVKRLIEERTHAKLQIDSVQGDVLISSDDGLHVYTAREIVTAIGRGFHPDIALKLMDMETSFLVMPLPESRKKKYLLRIKGRLIGSEGKTRHIIEEMTDTHMSVYGKTVAIIGQQEHALVARKAVEMLLEGSPHANVYRFLERKRRSLRRNETLSWQ
ncbi:RNA-processing protein [Candidatus Woesearchaeota archaeon]|nr:RNA-processing protein [Candidatus Woesearchaeota archaeon]